MPLPLYCQESMFKQYGIELNRKTMSSWMLKITPLLMLIYERMHRIQLQQPVIHADETTLKVIHEDKNKCYMWVYCTGTDSPNDENIEGKNKPPNIVLYDYQNSRAGRCAKDYLKDFNGTLQRHWQWQPVQKCTRAFCLVRDYAETICEW